MGIDMNLTPLSGHYGEKEMGQVREWLSFDEQPSKGKTKIWTVIAMASCTCIGEIKWCCGWRRYAFYPDPDTVYEQKCLRKIAGFVESATANQRATWKKRKVKGR